MDEVTTEFGMGLRRTRTCRRRLNALTLIEVVASLVLIGSAVTTVLVAQANAVETVAKSKFFLQARGIATNLIADWRITRVNVARADQGGVVGRIDWSWRRSASPHPMDGQKELVEIVLEVRQINPGRGAERVSEYRWLLPAEEQNTN